MRRNHLFLAGSLMLICTSAFAMNKHSKAADAAPQDQIEVVGHLALSGDPVTSFQETQHYRRAYLYAEHQSGTTVSLVDITNITQPTLLSDIHSGAPVAVAGNAALVSSQTSVTPIAVTSRTFRIMSFADPLHPSVKQQFDHVTAMERDEKRGLIFLANDEGIWILRQKLAQDPEAEKEWEHMMLDNR